MSFLQRDARISNAEIARRIGIAPSGVFERIKKLEGSGVIQGYHARLDPSACGLDLLAFVFVQAEDPSGSLNTDELLARIPEAQEVFHIAGEDCYLLKVRVKNAEELRYLLRGKIGTIESVRSTRTTIVLSSIKEDTALPLAGGPTKPGRKTSKGNRATKARER